MYDIYGPPGPPNRRRPTPQQALPTLDDYEKLASAYRELQPRVDALTKELAATRSEVAIKDEALHKQSEDLKKTQSELLWTKAALQSAEAANAEAGEAGKEGWQERYMRLQADVDNLRRRWEQRATDDTAAARKAILRDMLPLADHLELALQHADTLRADKAGAAFVGNIESTLRAFLEAMRRFDVVQQTPLGKLFDPELYEAVGQVVTQETTPGHVAHVVLSGYMEGDKLLRPARVIVSQERPA